MKEKLFDFHSYKSYLRSRTGTRTQKNGVKAALARSLSCQPTYISQVLHGLAHFSLEQAEGANHFFAHTKEESRFFLLLVQKDRAGTKTLAQHFQDQIDEMLQRRLVIGLRLGPKKALNSEDQSIYYSSWLYAAVHIALTIPELRTRESLAKHLGAPAKRVSEVLEFLVAAGLASQNGSGFNVGTSHVRLGRDSHNILKHHANWRAQAVESLEREELQDLHYSGVVSLSTADVLRIKNVLMESIETAQSIVRSSNEEELCAINIDFFNLQR